VTLILLKPPVQPDQSMVQDNSHIIRPGGQPPFVSPHCRKCLIPVETWTIDALGSWYHLTIQVTCHGKTTGAKFGADQVTHCRRTGEPLWFF
jgi:hypothetical protein